MSPPDKPEPIEETPQALVSQSSWRRVRQPLGFAIVPAMSNVATRKDVRDAVRVMTIRMGVAVVFITAAAAALILAH
jgi:hypothetical protein